jgi:hypothetical protein
MCLKNKANQNYLFKYIFIFKDHLGYGSIVTQFLEELIHNNDDLLHVLDNIQQAQSQYNINLI